MEEIENLDKSGLTVSSTDEKKRQLKRIYVSRFPNKGTIQPINTILLRNCIFYAQNLLLADQNCEGDEFIKCNFYHPTYKFSETLLSQVVSYS